MPWVDCPCDLCHSTEQVAWEEVEDYRLHTGGRHTLVRCRQCGLAWFSARRQEQGGQHVGDADHGRLACATHQSGGTVESRHSFRDRLKRVMLTRRRGYACHESCTLLTASLERLIRPCVARRLERIPDYVPGGRLLDIGSGSGHYTAAMAALGWQTLGVEPDVTIVHPDQTRPAAMVVAGYAEDLPVATGRFDVVTLWHVLEHAFSPAGALAEAHRALRRGGVLLLETPNIDSVQARLFGRYWFHLDPPRHRFLFSPATVRAYLDSSGFKDIRVKTIPSSVGIAGSLQTLLRLLTHRRGLKLLHGQLAQWAWEPIAHLEALRGRGGCLWVAARAT